MKILLTLNTRYPYFPPEIFKLSQGDYPGCRMGELLSRIQEEARKNRYLIADISDEFLKSIPDNKIYMLYVSDEFYYCKQPGKSRSQIYKICEVSTTKPWTIIKTSGGERIKYFKPGENYKIIDEELMYAEEVD